MEQRYRGNFTSWADAEQASTGYASAEILERVVTATRATRAGKAKWERDSVLFDEAWANEPLLRVLREVAGREGRLDVLDFGGALGSTWWQHREWLQHPAPTRWSVVEQPDFVEAGRQEFETGPLRFYRDIAACCKDGDPNVILLSSVLPYLQDPHAFLRVLAAELNGTLIIDRTGFVNEGDDRLTVQHVSADVYGATYPCWFFNREKFLESLGADWQVQREWASFDGDGKTFRYRGLVLARTAAGH